MEVKIKNSNELIDATIEIVDDVMVVSPKDIKMRKIDLTQFRDGDILYCSWGYKQTEWVAILKGEVEYMDDTHVFMEDYCSLYLTGDIALEVEGYSDSATFVRHATEEEKQKLFQALADEEYEWDVDKRELVKLKWKPKINEAFYFPLYELGHFVANSDVFFEGEKELLKTDTDVVRGWVFRTKQECQEFCDRLNKAIENIKP